jgi:hypothetical protein
MSLGEHDWWNKVVLFEDTTRIPMIAVNPQKYVRIIPWVSLQLLFVGAMSLIAGGRQWLSRHVITGRKRKGHAGITEMTFQ